MDIGKERVLVTGADGFIGSHLVEALLRRGRHVRAFVAYNSFGSWGWLDRVDADLLGSAEIVAGDIRDAEGVRAAMTSCGSVFHLAALISIPFSYNSPASYVETNVVGTLNVVQAARVLGTPRVLITSTSEVYGTAQYVPIDETHPLQAQSPYSASKIGAEQIALSFHRSFATPVVVARPFNTYGPRQSARAVLPTIISQIAAGQRTIRLGSLTPTRDFNFVLDTVEGLIRLAECDQAVGEVVNLGSNFEISIGDAASLIAELMGQEVELTSEEGRTRPSASEVQRLWACNGKATTLVGWKPAYGGVEGFRRGLEETIEWFSRSDNLSAYKTHIYNV